MLFVFQKIIFLCVNALQDIEAIRFRKLDANQFNQMYALIVLNQLFAN